MLFNAVRRYLEEHEDELGLEFCISKDSSGGKKKQRGGIARAKDDRPNGWRVTPTGSSNIVRSISALLCYLYAQLAYEK